MEWNGGMDWTGMAEWNAESNRVLRRMRTWYHLSSYEKFLVCGAVSLGYILSRGDGLRGLEHSLARSMN